jgi:WD40 repeat protein
MQPFTMRRTLLFSLAVAAYSAAADPSYFRDVRPILQRVCQGCHQPALKSGNLDLTTFEGLATGGKRGPSFAPGNPEASILVKYLTGELKPQMPLGQPPLPAEQIAMFRDWIRAGAKDDTPAAARETITPDKPIEYQRPPVITALAFSPDGKHLAVSGYRETLIHTADGSSLVKRLPGLSERIQGIAWSSDGKLLVVSGGTPARFGEVQFWDFAAGKLLHSTTLTNDTVFGGALSPDGRRVAVGGADYTVRILDAATGQELHRLASHENWVLATVFGVDGKRLVSVGRDRAAKLTDVQAGQFLENINLLRGELAALARHPARDIVVIGGEDRIPYIYAMDRPRNMKIADDSTLLRKLDRQNGAILALAWSPDGKYIAVGGAAPEVTLYDADSGVLKASLKGHSAGIYALAFSPDSSTLATGGFDGQVRLYRIPAGELIKAFVPVPLSPSLSSIRSQP